MPAKSSTPVVTMPIITVAPAGVPDEFSLMKIPGSSPLRAASAAMRFVPSDHGRIAVKIVPIRMIPSIHGMMKLTPPKIDRYMTTMPVVSPSTFSGITSKSPTMASS